MASDVPTEQRFESDRVRPRLLIGYDLSATAHSQGAHYETAEIASAIQLEERLSSGQVEKQILGYAEFPADQRVGTHRDEQGFRDAVEERAMFVFWKDTDDKCEDEPVQSESEQDLVCDIDGCDYSTTSERGLAIHQGRTHSEDDKTNEENQTVDHDECDVLDHTSTEDLQQAYDEADGNVRQAAERFEIGYSGVFRRMKEHDVHTPECSDTKDDESENSASADTPDGTGVSHDSKADRDDVLVKDEADDEESGANGTEPEQDKNGAAAEDESGETGDGDSAFPRKCHCGATLETSLELAIHRTEEHGVPQATLGHLEPGEFEETVRDADGIHDLVDAVDWSRERTLRMLGIYGIQDAIGGSDEDDGTVSQRPTSVTATDGGPAAADGQSSNPSTTASTEPTPALDLSTFGLTRQELVDAIEGARTVYHVQRDLGLDRDSTTDILDELQLLDKLSAGCAPIPPREAEIAVKEVA